MKHFTYILLALALLFCSGCKTVQQVSDSINKSATKFVSDMEKSFENALQNPTTNAVSISAEGEVVCTGVAFEGEYIAPLKSVSDNRFDKEPTAEEIAPIILSNNSSISESNENIEYIAPISLK